MVRLFLGLVCLVHGVAHLVGFFAAWRPSVIPELQHKTTVLSGKLDLGEAGIRVMGVLWLMLAVAFVCVGAMVVLKMPLAIPAVLAAAAVSGVLSLIAWPESQIGVFVNLGVAAFVFAALRYGWL